MHAIENSYGAFSEEFEIPGDKGLITVHPEMEMSPAGIKPTNRYHIFCVHPHHGSCNFTMEQDEHGLWKSDKSIPFIDKVFIEWVGSRIELYYK